ncbi:MAG: sigma-54-dependent Fis family transcriptional regulator [Deltaproteobacteria bacterium]|nr:MAG: sigma-54-dependent Fis family transcriptional regulator [Deltaproteobacteria bacterium]
MKTRGRGPVVVLEPVKVSPAMRAFDRTLRAVASKDVTVTFVGESGSGKEVMARRLHDLSARRGGPFVPINCAAIPDALFESELFGHERGAFTGAVERGTGKIEIAGGGTLFLDEVAEMPLAAQPKLLRFLETHRYMRVGGTKKLDVDVRVVLATLRPLEAEVREGRFREDLYYRIQGITLAVPPLRERRRDIPMLIDTFVRQLSAIHNCAPARLSRSARAALVAHDWPGNVRQLRNAIELVTILRSGKTVRLHDLPPSFDSVADPAAPGAGGALSMDLDQPLADMVDQLVRHVIAIERGDLARAARRLGVSVRTLQRRRRA